MARSSVVGLMSVGWCFRRGSSRNRAPVSITQRSRCCARLAARVAAMRRGKSGANGIEVVDVERERDAAVAQFGEDLDGVFEPVVGEAVGVVAEEHACLELRRVLTFGQDRFQDLHLRHLLPKLLFERRDDRHDRRGAAGADAREPHRRDAVGHLQHLDAVAVEQQRRGDVVLQGVLDAVA